MPKIKQLSFADTYKKCAGIPWHVVTVSEAFVNQEKNYPIYYISFFSFSVRAALLYLKYSFLLLLLNYSFHIPTLSHLTSSSAIC